MTGTLILKRKFGHRYGHAQREVYVKRHSEKVAVYKPRIA